MHVRGICVRHVTFNPFVIPHVAQAGVQLNLICMWLGGSVSCVQRVVMDVVLVDGTLPPARANALRPLASRFPFPDPLLQALA